ncbi:MAG: hypothetical protein NW224_15080 [Leptolyngbyaceae cyanobacterium bins.302]|nr:hypothetical protein [Leptolyngbyaceae cyanobacterium bins.302]
MKEILYIEVPTPDTIAVKSWLKDEFNPEVGKKIITPDGIRLQFSSSTFRPSAISETSLELPDELAIVVWTVQRTTYLKAFRWATKPLPREQDTLRYLINTIRKQFPHHYPSPPAIDLTQTSIFEALADQYPLTVRYFQKMPNGEYDLSRVYWWEQRWRESVKAPQHPKQVIFRSSPNPQPPTPTTT